MILVSCLRIKFKKILSKTFSKKTLFFEFTFNFSPVQQKYFNLPWKTLCAYKSLHAKNQRNLPSGSGIMVFPSYKISKISTRQDRQLRMCRNCHATLGTRFQVCLFQVYSLGVSFALMTFFTFEKVTFWVDRCLSKNITSFVFQSLDHWHQM